MKTGYGQDTASVPADGPAPAWRPAGNRGALPPLQRLVKGGPVPPHQVAPDDFCYRCGKVTPGVYLPLGRAVGNCCRLCFCCRRGRPYGRRPETTTDAPQRAEGANHGYPCR